MLDRKKIFFDGFLPRSKRPVRIRRLMSSTKQLNQYYQAWPHNQFTNSASQQPSVKLSNSGPALSGFTKPPAPPFLVPAIIEALSQYKSYENLVELVPAEADIYCADYVKIHGGVVFTGDSDLLIHDLGDGIVSFFNDIDLAASRDKASLICIQYQARAIVQRLGLPETHGLAALAFEMTVNAQRSFKEHLQKATKLNAISLHATMYQEFVNGYEALQTNKKVKETCDSGNAVHCPSLSRQLKMLDPRVSEYLLQFSKFAQAAGLQESYLSDLIKYKGQVDFFLPFLLDSPQRTSAWEMSTSIRQLAYGLVNMVLPHEENVLKVTEYRRLQNGSRGRELQVPDAQHLPKACTDLSELFKKLRNSMSVPVEQDMWRQLALYQDLELNLRNGRSGLSGTFIEQSKSGKASSFRLTWESIHLYAQFQGSYYSFRILKQILEIVLLCNSIKYMQLALHQLHIDLQSLPTIEKLLPISDLVRSIGGPEDQAILEMIRKSLDIQDADGFAEPFVRLSKKNRKTGSISKEPKLPEGLQQRDELKRQPKKPNNLFELLSPE